MGQGEAAGLGAKRSGVRRVGLGGPPASSAGPCRGRGDGPGRTWSCVDAGGLCALVAEASGPWRSSRAGRARGGPHLCGGSLSVPTVPVPRLLSRPLAQLSVRAESKAAPGPAHVPGRRGPRAALHFSWALRAWRMPAVVRAPPPHPGPTLPGGCLSVPSPVLTVAASSELSGPPLRVRASPRLQWRR